MIILPSLVYKTKFNNVDNNVMLEDDGDDDTYNNRIRWWKCE